MNKAPVLIAMFCAMIALVGCSSRADERAAASSGAQSTAAAPRPAPEATTRQPPPQTAPAPQSRAAADQNFRQDQRK
jgi:hypothetical protein